MNQGGIGGRGFLYHDRLVERALLFIIVVIASNIVSLFQVCVNKGGLYRAGIHCKERERGYWSVLMVRFKSHRCKIANDL